MFGFLKSKDIVAKEKEVNKTGMELFKQISQARELVRAGKLREGEFNTRFSSFFSAGYWEGFVDEKLDKLFNDDKLKKKYTENIYNGIIPNRGAKWVTAKGATYMVGNTISKDSDKYQRVHEELRAYELGVIAGRLDMAVRMVGKQDAGSQLFQYLATGEIRDAL